MKDKTKTQLVAELVTTFVLIIGILFMLFFAIGIVATTKQLIMVSLGFLCAMRLLVALDKWLQGQEHTPTH